MSRTTSKEIITYMESLRNEEQRLNLMRFFKTGKGDYGEGDEFLGLKVPQTRLIVKHSTELPIEEIPELLTNRFHEVRLCGFLLLVHKFEKLSGKRLENNDNAIIQRDGIVRLYMEYADYANNWDLVDMSAPKIMGRWLMLPSNISDKQKMVDDLAMSGKLWRERISMVCTWMTTHMGDPSWCLRYAEIHLNHSHDLMHKAVGWMLREMGKMVSMDLLREFLRQHIHDMPRTTLRYAIEKMPEEERKHWMNL